MPTWGQVLAHSHWLTLHVFGRELRLCARCSGMVLGFVGSKIVVNITAFFTAPLPLSIGVLSAFLLFLPTIIDWTTQSWGARQSTNSLRSMTGFLNGMGIVSLSLSDGSLLSKVGILTGCGIGIVLVGFLGRRLVPKNV
ncbi:DUF2085 domain-containing protein [Candidatus Bathyarchaeota archaeon]|nr:DUF2085 domain-containing protein [Candidatus Bathyarchaeota archaeon]